MKKILLVAFLFLGGRTAVISQSPDTQVGRLRDLTGKQVIASTFDNAGKPYIICFWSRANADSYRFLSKMNELYKSWQEQTGVKLITVAVDEATGSDKISPFIQAKGWKYENYIDEEQGYKKLMNVYDIPHIFVFNGKKELILQLSAYQEGDELAIFTALNDAQ